MRWICARSASISLCDSVRGVAGRDAERRGRLSVSPVAAWRCGVALVEQRGDLGGIELRRGCGGCFGGIGVLASVASSASVWSSASSFFRASAIGSLFGSAFFFSGLASACFGSGSGGVCSAVGGRRFPACRRPWRSDSVTGFGSADLLDQRLGRRRLRRGLRAGHELGELGRRRRCRPAAIPCGRRRSGLAANVTMPHSSRPAVHNATIW